MDKARRTATQRKKSGSPIHSFVHLFFSFFFFTRPDRRTTAATPHLTGTAARRPRLVRSMDAGICWTGLASEFQGGKTRQGRSLRRHDAAVFPPFFPPLFHPYSGSIISACARVMRLPCACVWRPYSPSPLCPRPTRAERDRTGERRGGMHGPTHGATCLFFAI